MVCRFFGQMPGDRAAGADGRKFLRVQRKSPEHVVIIVARLQVHQTRARGIRKIGRVHAAREPVNEIVLALQEPDRFFVDLRLVFMQPDCFGKREVRREDIAGNAVEIIRAVPVQQRTVCALIDGVVGLHESIHAVRVREGSGQRRVAAHGGDSKKVDFGKRVRGHDCNRVVHADVAVQPDRKLFHFTPSP